MTGSMCLVEINGSPLPDDLVPLLVSAYVEDSQRLPDLFTTRFRDPERIVLSKSGAKVGGAITIKVNTAQSSSPITLRPARALAVKTFCVMVSWDPWARRAESSDVVDA